MQAVDCRLSTPLHTRCGERMLDPALRRQPTTGWVVPRWLQHCHTGVGRCGAWVERLHPVGRQALALKQGLHGGQTLVGRLVGRLTGRLFGRAQPQQALHLAHANAADGNGGAVLSRRSQRSAAVQACITSIFGVHGAMEQACGIAGRAGCRGRGAVQHTHAETQTCQCLRGRCTGQSAANDHRALRLLARGVCR